MSGRQQHKLRYNLKLQYIDKFEDWLYREPPVWRFIAWCRWKNARPKMPRASSTTKFCPMCGRYSWW